MALASFLMVLGLTIVGVLVALELPADRRLPIHWGLDGRPDGWADKWTALLLPPGITAATALLFYALPALEPKQEGLSRSQGLYLWGWAALLLIMAIIEVSVLSVALGWGVPVNHLITGGLGVVLVMIGNQLGKSRRMYMIGLRTPWTLSSEEVWIKTHRLAGKLMVGAGAVAILSALLPLPAGLLVTIVVTGIGAAALIPIVYSYLLWRDERRSGQASE
jgi:uncharacterized membrane protein